MKTAEIRPPPMSFGCRLVFIFTSAYAIFKCTYTKILTFAHLNSIQKLLKLYQQYMRLCVCVSFERCCFCFIRRAHSNGLESSISTQAQNRNKHMQSNNKKRNNPSILQQPSSICLLACLPSCQPACL